MVVAGIISRIRGIVYGIIFTVAGFGAFLYLFLSSGLAPPSVNDLLINLSPFTQSTVGSSLPMNTGQLVGLSVMMVLMAVMGCAGLYVFFAALFRDDFYMESGGAFGAGGAGGDGGDGGE